MNIIFSQHIVQGGPLKFWRGFKIIRPCKDGSINIFDYIIHLGIFSITKYNSNFKIRIVIDRKEKE
jgi:hypothetical protein